MLAKIRTNRLILRPLHKGDEKALVINMNDIDICRGLKDVEYPFKIKHAKQWISFNKKMWHEKNTKTIPFGIILKKNKSLIGGISLNKYNKKNNSAEIGYWIGKKYWGKGYAEEAAASVITFCFSKIGLKKIDARVLFYNVRSKKLLKKLGFTKKSSKNVVICKADNKKYTDLTYVLLKDRFDKYSLFKNNNKTKI